MRYQLSFYLIYSGFTETKAEIGLILVKNNCIQFFLISSRVISYVHTFTKSVGFFKRHNFISEFTKQIYRLNHFNEVQVSV